MSTDAQCERYVAYEISQKASRREESVLITCRSLKAIHALPPIYQAKLPEEKKSQVIMSLRKSNYSSTL